MGRVVDVAWKVLAGVSGLFHVLFFVVESILFTHSKVQARFGIEDPNIGEALRVVFLNQGFYNLFLALGTFGGLVLLKRCEPSGRALILFTCACYVGAGIVLACSEPKLLTGALVQAGPPALALACFAFSLKTQPPADPSSGG